MQKKKTSSSRRRRPNNLPVRACGLLLVTSLVACGQKNLPPTKSTHAQNVAIQTSQSISIQLRSQPGREGYTRYIVTLMGLSGPTNALVQFNISGDEKILNPMSDNGWITTNRDTAFIVTSESNTSFSFELSNSAENKQLEAVLKEVSNGSQLLKYPLTAKLINNPSQQVFTNQPTSYSKDNLEDFIQKISSSHIISSSSLDSLKLDDDIKESWLKYEVGDVDKNGKVDINDTIILTLALAGINKLDSISKFNADILDDGEINTDDLKLLIKKTLNMITASERAYNIHPRKIDVSNGEKILSVRSINGSHVSAKVEPDSSWIKLTEVQEGVHPSGLAFNLRSNSQSQTDEKGSVAIKGEGTVQKIQVITSAQNSTDIFPKKDKISIDYKVKDIRDKDLSVQSPYGKKPTNGISGRIEVLNRDSTAYPLYLIDSSDKITAVTYYFNGADSVTFSPEESSKAAVLSSPFAQFSDYNKLLAFRDALSKDKYLNRLDEIQKQQRRDGNLFSDETVKLATQLAIDVALSIVNDSNLAEARITAQSIETTPRSNTLFLELFDNSPVEDINGQRVTHRNKGPITYQINEPQIGYKGLLTSTTGFSGSATIDAVWGLMFNNSEVVQTSEHLKPKENTCKIIDVEYDPLSTERLPDSGLPAKYQNDIAMISALFDIAGLNSIISKSSLSQLATALAKDSAFINRGINLAESSSGITPKALLTEISGLSVMLWNDIIRNLRPENGLPSVDEATLDYLKRTAQYKSNFFKGAVNVASDLALPIKTLDTTYNVWLIADVLWSYGQARAGRLPKGSFVVEPCLPKLAPLSNITLKGKVGQKAESTLSLTNIGNPKSKLKYSIQQQPLNPVPVQFIPSDGTIIGNNTHSISVSHECKTPETMLIGRYQVKVENDIDGQPHPFEVRITCENNIPVPEVGSSIISNTNSYGNECSQTTETNYQGFFWGNVNLNDPEIKPIGMSTTLGGNQIGKNGIQGWIGAGTHNLVATFNAESGSSSSEPHVFTVPPKKIEIHNFDCGGNAGDPHLMSLDGQRFSFQGVGEYIFSRTPNRDFEVQMRFHQMGEQGSANSAIAMNVAGDRVGFYALGIQSGGGMAMMRVNGAEIPITLTSIQMLKLPMGGRVEIAAGKIRIVWPNSNFVNLRWSGNFFDFVTVGVLPEYRNQLEGLLGNDSRDRQDDFKTRDGIQLPNPPTFEQLYRQFGDSWRVRPEESLFDYGPGQSTATFTKLNFPPAPMPFTASQVDQAKSVCRSAGVTTQDVLQDCIFDVSNAPESAEQLAQAAVMVDPARPSVSIIPSYAEIPLSGEISLGAVVKGSADSSEVTWQADRGIITPKSNGSATFKAPDDAGPVKITATLHGQSTTANVDVRSGLIEAPANIKVYEQQSVDVQVRLIANTNNASLKWAAQRGTISGSGNQVRYTAPSISGDDILSVEIEGQPKTRTLIPVQVLTPTIQVNPQIVTLYTGDTIGLNALLAGFNNEQSIQWTTSGGNLNQGLGAAVYTAPNVAGQYTVTATVANRQDVRSTTNINVIKVDPVAAIEGPQRIHAGQRAIFHAINTDGSPYIMSSLQWKTTGGRIEVIDDSTIAFTADATDSVTITATPTRLPGTPTQKNLEVYIDRPILRFSNGTSASAIIPVNEHVRVEAVMSDGSPYPLPIDWSATGGNISSDGNFATFTAGSATGEYQISAIPRAAVTYRSDLPLRVVQRITGETRFILTWGASPSDLDTHLWLPASTPYHVYYARRGIDSSCPFAQLDQDSTSGYGPEVMRVKGLTGSDGLYSLQIYNYSGDSTFTQAQAQVQVVSTATGEVLTTVNVPNDNASGRWWNVLTFDAKTGIINVINTVGDLTEPYNDTVAGCSISTQSLRAPSIVTETNSNVKVQSTKPAWTPGLPFHP